MTGATFCQGERNQLSNERVFGDLVTDWPRAVVHLEYVYRFEASSLKNGKKEILPSIGKRVVVDHYSDGSFRETCYRLDGGEPLTETLFDGEMILKLENSVDSSNLLLFVAPPVSESFGLHCDNIMVCFGHTSFCLKDKWNLFSIAAQSIRSDTNTQASRLITSDTAIGQIKIEVDPQCSQLRSVSIFASRPEDQIGGIAIAKAKRNSVYQEFGEFSYVEPTTDNFLGLTRFATNEIHEYLSGDKRLVKGEVVIEKLAFVSTENSPVSLKEPIEFVTKISKNAPVISVGNPYVEYQLSGGKLERVPAPFIEDNLRSLKLEFVSPRFDYRIWFWLAGGVISFVVIAKYVYHTRQSTEEEV